MQCHFPDSNNRYIICFFYQLLFFNGNCVYSHFSSTIWWNLHDHNFVLYRVPNKIWPDKTALNQRQIKIFIWKSVYMPLNSVKLLCQNLNQELQLKRSQSCFFSKKLTFRKLANFVSQIKLLLWTKITSLRKNALKHSKIIEITWNFGFM